MLKNNDHGIDGRTFRGDESTRLFLLALLFFGALSVLAGGYHVFRYNQSIQIPLVYLLNNGALFPSDPFAATLPTYASLFWWVVAAISRVLPLETTLFVLFILEKLILVYAAAHLAGVLAPASRVAVIGAMALFALGLQPIVGGGTITADYTEHTAFSIPFFLLAAAAFYQTRMYLWAFWMALGFGMNSMYGAYALTYFGAAFLLDGDYRREWLKWLAAFGLFLLLSVPTILITLTAYARAAVDKELWFFVAQQRFPHHLFPLSWDRLAYLKLGVYAALVVGVSVWQYREYPRIAKFLLVWTGVAAAWIGFAFVAAHVFGQPWMLVLHPGRATDIWYALSALALLAMFADLFRTCPGPLAARVALLAMLTLIVFWQPLSVTMLGILAGVALLVVVFGNVIVNRQAAASVLVLTALLIGAAGLAGRFSPQAGIAAAVMVQPPAEQLALADWLKNNTGIEDSVLFPPNWSQFRALSQRPAFVTVKDASAILWHRSYVEDWVERLHALGYDIKREEGGLARMKARAAAVYAGLDDQAVAALATRYPLAYWVVERDKQSSFPVVFATASYSILRID